MLTYSRRTASASTLSKELARAKGWQTPAPHLSGSTGKDRKPEPAGESVPSNAADSPVKSPACSMHAGLERRVFQPD